MWNLEILTFFLIFFFLLFLRKKSIYQSLFIYLFHKIHMVQPIAEIGSKNKTKHGQYWKTGLFYDEARLVQDVNNATNIIHWYLWI